MCVSKTKEIHARVLLRKRKCGRRTDGRPASRTSEEKPIPTSPHFVGRGIKKWAQQGYTPYSVTSVHTLLSRLAIPADSLVLILKNTQYLDEGEGWVHTDTGVVRFRQFETHVQSVSSLGTTYTIFGVNKGSYQKVMTDILILSNMIYFSTLDMEYM